MQVDDAVLEALEDDVAAVLGHRRAHPGVEQFLDLGDDLVVLGFRHAVARGSRPSASRTGRSAVKCSMMTPSMAGFSTLQSLSSALVTVTKSRPRKTPADALDLEQALRQRRAPGASPHR